MTLTSLILVAKTNLSGSMSSIIMLVAFAAGGFVGWKVYSKFEKPGLSPLETDFKAFALAAVAFFTVVLGIGYLLVALFGRG